MAFSNTVAGGDDATAAQYNDLRKDVIIGPEENASITYNAQGLIETYTDNGVTLTYTYNAQGLVSTVTDGTDTWTYTYSSQNLITSIVKS